MKGKLIRSFSLQLFVQPIPLAAKASMSFLALCGCFRCCRGACGKPVRRAGGEIWWFCCLQDLMCKSSDFHPCGGSPTETSWFCWHQRGCQVLTSGICTKQGGSAARRLLSEEWLLPRERIEKRLCEEKLILN